MLKHILFATMLVGCATEEEADAPDEPTTTTTTEQAVTGIGNDTLQEYAAKCDAAVGLHVPQFNCDAMTAATLDGQDMNADGKCQTPNVLNHRCDKGARFQVLAQNADASIVAHCRKLGRGPGFFGDIAIIQYNKKNGATCFYQALGELPGTDVRPPSEGVSAWKWQAPSTTHGQACTGCHDNGAFIRSPYLAQLTTAPNALPSLAQGYDNNTTPVKWVGLDFANDRSWSITRTGDPTCTTCHRLAVNNWGNGFGTGTDYALEATADNYDPASTDLAKLKGHPAKLPHGPLTATTSPIWMLKGGTAFSQSNFDAATAISNCGKSFLQYGSAPGCGFTPLGDAYSPGITNGGEDIIALGSSFEGSGLAVGFSNGSGSFAVTNTTVDWFSGHARLPGVQRVSGDFNHDGRTDFALIGGQGWNTVPVAFSNGDGTFSLTNYGVGPDFNNWARTPGAKPYVGDFNKDGYSDIALAGVGGWNTIPIAFSWGGGTWNVTNYYAGNFPSWTATAGAKVYVGDYNKDGYSDLAVMGNSGWTQIPVAFSAGGGTWQITQGGAPNMNQWVSGAHVTALVGDFNKDGYSDIALTGGAGWGSIPIAFAAGGGSWQITNYPAGDFGAWSSNTNSKPLVGDFNKDGYSDIALVGVSGWASIPIAMSAGSGTWQITNQWIGWDFPAWSGTAGVRPLAGDFNGDGYTDVALTGGNWSSIPVAFNAGFGNFNVTNNSVTYMPSVTADPNATVVVGRVN